MKPGHAAEERKAKQVSITFLDYFKNFFLEI
jgi:hypothetical protein